MRQGRQNRQSGRPRSIPDPLAQQPLSLSGRESLPSIYVRTALRQPNVYRKRVTRGDSSARPGGWVAVYAEPDHFVGYGLYNPRSEIVLRIIAFGDQLPNEEFWDERVRSAVGLRHDLLQLQEVTDAYRLIHAEGDGFPGLVVDRYGDVLSAEVFSLGMWQRCRPILDRMARLTGTQHSVVRLSPHVLSQEGFEHPPVVSESAPHEVRIQEFGTRFLVQFAAGHKTGFFCDQRENRRRLAEFCRGKSVLDLCCYTGGFAIQAKRLGGAQEVIGVEIDEAPCELARQNAALNQCRIRFVRADVFTYMRDMIRLGRQFDVVVLDPPKLIRSRQEVELGTRKYFDLNRLALQLVAPGGLLLTCTCSGLMSSDRFVDLVAGAAQQSGDAGGGSNRGASRVVQILAETGAAADHPVAVHFRESEYLCCVWLRVSGGRCGDG